VRELSNRKITELWKKNFSNSAVSGELRADAG